MVRDTSSALGTTMEAVIEACCFAGVSKRLKLAQQALWHTLETLTSVLRPYRVQAQSTSIQVQMLRRQIPMLIRSQTRHEGSLVQKPTMWCTRGQQVRDFLSCHGPPVGLGVVSKGASAFRGASAK
jgi:hypothetical protein